MIPEENGNVAPRIFSPFLEGLRGFAALWVVLGHLRRELLDSGNGWIWMKGLQFIDENLAVPVFIVLSGYLLASPVARGKKWSGWLAFMGRRFRRIYPAYLVALVASSALLLWIPYLRELATPRAPDVARLTWENFGLHLIMGHMINISTQYSINPVMWSLAPEWWVYLFFAIVGAPLLILRQRFLLLIACLVGYGAFCRFNDINGYIFISFWIGVSTAYLAMSPQKQRLAGRVPQLVLFGLLGIVAIFFLFGSFEVKMRLRFFSAAITGSVVILLGAEDGHCADVIRAVFESKFATWLGKISYSLYLVHFPLLSLFNSVSLHSGIAQQGLRSTVAILGGLTTSFIAAQLLSNWVEYRFVLQRR
ncbi:MAG: hypothetical protein CBB60_000265 [Armatimonadetes bacterium Cent15-Ar3]|nr:MAG: hypothetical protein CBB60_000265 [Armatimonadetes bacterium Cent15-Ar3]